MKETNAREKKSMVARQLEKDCHAERRRTRHPHVVKIVFNAGPFNLFPANKLTGFSIENDVDVSRRRMIRVNRLPTYDFDSVSSIEYNKIKDKR